MTKRNLKTETILTSMAFVIALYFFNQFANFVEGRPGSTLADPFLALLPPTKLTWLTFLLIYGSLAIAVMNLKKYPDRFLFGVQAYVCMILARMLVMYLTPLDPPIGMILLRDPVVELFSSERQLTRDLFFSGHTATVFLFFLMTPTRSLKIFFSFATVVVAICLLLQHVHYTTDVVAAPFFTYGCYRLVGFFRQRYLV